MRIVWAPLAQTRTIDAATYIAKDNPEAAEQWVIGLFDAIGRLQHLPNLGRMVPEIGRPEIREILYRRYRVIYRVSTTRVDILTVRHQRRLFDPAEIIGTTRRQI